jgi:hypothetical protein
MKKISENSELIFISFILYHLTRSPVTRHRRKIIAVIKATDDIFSPMSLTTVMKQLQQ